MGLTVQLRGAKKLATRLNAAAAIADVELRKALDETSQGAVFVFRGKAPQRTGRLRRGVTRRFEGANTIVIEAHARNPESGYDYVGATRFGRGPIRAKNARALRFTIGGRTVFRRSVGPYRPARDWADGAVPEVKRIAVEATSRAGGRVAARIGGGGFGEAPF